MAKSLFIHKNITVDQSLKRAKEFYNIIDVERKKRSIEKDIIVIQDYIEKFMSEVDHLENFGAGMAHLDWDRYRLAEHEIERLRSELCKLNELVQK